MKLMQRRAAIGLCMSLGLACIAAAALAAEKADAMTAAPTGSASAATAAPPLLIDLDHFDSLKRATRLSNGLRLSYIDTGNPHGRPVVLIHGYTDNARDWVPLIPHLSQGYRLILVDIRGHGASDKPECCYTRLDFAYDVKLLLDHLHVRQADIVGHSLGSIIAQTLAEFWPDRVRRVVLIASTGGPRKGAPKKPPAFDFVAEIKKLKEPIDPDSAFMIAWWDSPKPVDAEFIRRQRRDAAAIPLRVWLAVIEQGLTFDDLQATLPWLAAPTLLIWGSQDPIMEEEARQTLREALPAARVRIYDGLGHNPFWEEPQQVATAINGFLDEPR
jgi:pimeloyl-ACP methyl ester carboxylesterase